jgi:hypothetical protein
VVQRNRALPISRSSPHCRLFSSHPFLLPNLLAAFLGLAALPLVYLYVPETVLTPSAHGPGTRSKGFVRLETQATVLSDESEMDGSRHHQHQKGDCHQEGIELTPVPQREPWGGDEEEEEVVVVIGMGGSDPRPRDRDDREALIPGGKRSDGGKRSEDCPAVAEGGASHEKYLRLEQGEGEEGEGERGEEGDSVGVFCTDRTLVAVLGVYCLWSFVSIMFDEVSPGLSPCSACIRGG